MGKKGEDEREFEIILDLELGEDEKIQSQPSKGMEVFLDQSDAGDIEATQEKPHQLEGIGKQDFVTQGPTSSKFLVEASFSLEENELEVERIPNYNMEDLTKTQGQSQDIELV